MAAVLDALAARVMNNIMDMGEAKMSMLLGVSHEIKKLEANVEPLRNILTDAERRRITDKSVQAWVTKLKSAMYEASDILDLCQLEAMDRHDKQHSRGLCLRLREKLPFLGCLGEKLQGVLQPFLFCVQNPGFANEVGCRIKNLNDELLTIRNGVAGFNFNIDLGSYEERRRPLTSSAHPRRENAQFVESDLVGDQIKKNAEELEHRLIVDNRHEHGSNIVKVVAIVGQGGIGKSTLAKKVFASEAIKEDFKMKIWLSITQQFTKVDLLRAAISQAGGEHSETKDETILVQDLTDALSKKKFLLVMDDVWNQEAWENVLRTPILNAAVTQPGSRVLVTSRKDDVVRSMGASILRVDTLNDEDAWCLLNKQLPQPQVGVGSDFDELKDIGMKIVKKCDGLPLAIKVMGGLLSTRNPNERDWENVLHKDFGWKEEDGPGEKLNYSVSLSYDDLSPELKQCFLYYSLLPK
ncbi:putative disease resistance protein RGA3, partial [Triticum dicoccoides]|uniref:putative disease resistance protein RGA3 n=1 Tax=Triticum dicoccoides TaxID=85692 RepID=UPI0018906236